MDKRTPLKPDQALILYTNPQEEGYGVKFHICQEIDRGGSSIVYDGSYRDSVDMVHPVRLKECYPRQEGLYRDDNGKIFAGTGQEGLKKARKKFVDAYRTQVEISRKAGLSNRVLHAFQLYYGNNTMYTVMDYMEGTDYGKVAGEELPKVIRRMRAVAMALERYHRAGFLYLDIKPENIWIIRESDDMVYLFDHDSVVRMEELPGISAGSITCTAGFEAPEVMRGETDKIGLTADVYGLGALLYYKLMGTCPGRRERERGARYDFSLLERENPLCRPLLFKQLGAFFSKTLAAVRKRRFGSMGEVAEELDKLLKLCDTWSVYAVDNFVYHQNCFVGRSQELEEMRRRLEEKHLLFLHGIGGIGKTELAVRYGYQNREKYDTILFLRVEDGLLDSLGREDISLCNFVREEEEGLQDYVARKLTALRSCLTERDLLILDNFDEEDELLEQILALPCPVVITSRLDYRDWNYPQMEVGRLGDMEEVMELFRAYNPISYEEEEMEAVREMVRRMDCHTMLTELLAKHLRVSGLSPVTVQERMEGKLGVGGLGGEAVRHRKGGKSLQASVQSHLRFLFDTSSLGQKEICILENLSLFAGVRIDQTMFLDWCGDSSAETVERLILRGWVEEWEGKKISLHQIVLDLIYGESLDGTEGEKCGGKELGESGGKETGEIDERKPGKSVGKDPGEHSGEKPEEPEDDGRDWARNLMRSMAEYAAAEPKNRMQRTIRNKLCGIVARRVQGRDDDTLAFYLSYCEHIQYQEEWADLCFKEWEKKPEHYKNELARVWILKGKAALRQMEDMDCFLDEELQRQAAEIAVDRFGKAAAYMEEGHFLFSIGSACSKAAENIFVNEPALLVLCRAGVNWMERGVELYEEETGRDDKTLSAMYRELMDFYDPDALVLGRPEHFADVEKRFFYGKKRKSLRLWDGCVELFGVSYTEAGEIAQRQGDLMAAVRYFETAAKTQEEEFMFCEDSLGLLYEELEEYEKAIQLFLWLFDERKEGITALRLGCLYGKMKDTDKAYEWLEKGIGLCGQNAAEDDKGYWKGWMLKGYLEGAGLPGERGRQMWKEGTAFYDREEQWVKGEEMAVEFQAEYGRRLMEEDAWGDDTEEERQPETVAEKADTKAGRILMDAGLNCLEHFLYKDSEKVAGLLEKAAESLEDGLVKAKAFWVCGKLMEKAEEKDEERAKGCYDRALMILEENREADKNGEKGYAWEEEEDQAQNQVTAAMEIWDKLAESYSSLGLYDKEEFCRTRCDHELLAWQNIKKAEKEADMDGGKQLKRQMEIWKDSGDKSREPFIKLEESEQDKNKRLTKATACYRQAKCMWDQMDGTERQISLHLFGSTMEAWFDAEMGKGDPEQAKNVLFQWQEALMANWEEICGQKEKRREFSWQLERLAKKLGETGNREAAILCSLKRGIVWLEAKGETENVKTDSDAASRAFFAMADRGISEEKIDEVLELCDTIAALCGGQKQWTELEAACERLTKRYREKQISFKS